MCKDFTWVIFPSYTELRDGVSKEFRRTGLHCTNHKIRCLWCWSISIGSKSYFGSIFQETSSGHEGWCWEGRCGGADYTSGLLHYGRPQTHGDGCRYGRLLWWRLHGRWGWWGWGWCSIWRWWGLRQWRVMMTPPSYFRLSAPSLTHPSSIEQERGSNVY